MNSAFRQLLIEWFERVRRPLPWRATSDAYAIWLSEVMLQQTRVATVIPYYERFLQRFPSPEALAEAPQEAVLQLWSGLGYYSRARNLQRAAQTMEGSFPQSYEEIRALPGVGDYTAAAIASIAFQLPHAAVDGNVLRVLARVTGNRGDIASPATRQILSRKADELLDKTRPGTFNEAVMELGATICLPRNPQCLLCPVESLCEARKLGIEDKLPVKSKKPAVIREERSLLVIKRDGQILFWQRPQTSKRLAGFWELPEPEHVPGALVGAEFGTFQHGIVNHSYFFRVKEGQLTSQPPELCWLEPGASRHLFSTTCRKALRIAGVNGF